MAQYDQRWAELEERRQRIAAELEGLDWRSQRRERERGQIGIFYRQRLQASLRDLHQRKTDFRRRHQALLQRIDENLATTPARRDRTLDPLKKRYGALVETMKGPWLERTGARAVERLAEVERSLQEAIAMREYEQDLATREQQIKERIQEQRQRVRSIQDELIKARNDHDDQIFAQRLDEQRQDADARVRAMEQAAERERQRQLSRLQLARDNEQRLKQAVAQEIANDDNVAELQARTATAAHRFEAQLAERSPGVVPDRPSTTTPTAQRHASDADSESSSSRNLKIVVDSGSASAARIDESPRATATFEDPPAPMPIVASRTAAMEGALSPKVTVTSGSGAMLMANVPVPDPAPASVAEPKRIASERESEPKTITARKESQAKPAAPAYQLVPRPKPRPASRLGLALIGLTTESSNDELSEQSPLTTQAPISEETARSPESAPADVAEKARVMRPKLNLTSLIAGDETDSDELSLELQPARAPTVAVPLLPQTPPADEFDF